VYCIFCREDLPNNAVYCSRCGKKLDQVNETGVKNKSNNTEPTVKVLYVDPEEKAINSGNPQSYSKSEAAAKREQLNDKIGLSDLDEGPILSEKSFLQRNKLRIISSLIAIELVILVVGFSNNSNNSNSSNDSAYLLTGSISDEEQGITVEDLLIRLNSAGSSTWTQDAFAPVSPSKGFTTSYLGDDLTEEGGCNLSIYDSEVNATEAVESELFINLGVAWSGIDYLTEQGIVLTAVSEENNCVTAAFSVFNWTR
jgi:hypothetical protein